MGKDAGAPSMMKRVLADMTFEERVRFMVKYAALKHKVNAAVKERRRDRDLKSRKVKR